MTRYKEIRLVYNKQSEKNEGLQVTPQEENELAAIELFEKKEDSSLEECFIPRLIANHNSYIASTIVFFVCLYGMNSNRRRDMGFW